MLANALVLTSSSASCAGVYHTTFEDNVGIGLCLRDISGGCEADDDNSSSYPPLFQRKTIAGPANVDMISGFLGKDVSINIAADVRLSSFRNNTAASLLRLYNEPVQPQDPLARGAALDILSVPYAVLVDLELWTPALPRSCEMTHLTVGQPVTLGNTLSM